MCGRFTASFEFRQRDLPIFAPRYNIAPSQQVPVIVRGAPGTGFVQAPPSGLATTFNNVTYTFTTRTWTSSDPVLRPRPLSALRQYGSWDKALIAACITNRVIPRKTRLGLLREIREAVESGSSIPRRYAQRLGITSKACEAPGLH
jgi:hypothetical protein